MPINRSTLPTCSSDLHTSNGAHIHHNMACLVPTHTLGQVSKDRPKLRLLRELDRFIHLCPFPVLNSTNAPAEDTKKLKECTNADGMVVKRHMEH